MGKIFELIASVVLQAGTPKPKPKKKPKPPKSGKGRHR